MKKTILLVSISLNIHEIHTQVNDEKRCNQYKFILECPVYRCDIFGNQLDSTFLITEVGAQFTLIYQDEEQCTIRFKEEKTSKKSKSVLGNKNQKYYKLSRAEFDYKVVIDEYDKWSLAVGNAITPIKLRFSPFAFSKDFAIGPTFGLRYTKNPNSIISYNFLSSFGISSISLDQYNTNQFLEDTQEVIAFTSSLGFMIEHKSFQLGLFLGLDLLNSNNSYNEYYVYNKKPWMSVGFGYSLFNKGN